MPRLLMGGGGVQPQISPDGGWMDPPFRPGNPSSGARVNPKLHHKRSVRMSLRIYPTLALACSWLPVVSVASMALILADYSKDDDGDPSHWCGML